MAHESTEGQSIRGRQAFGQRVECLCLILLLFLQEAQLALVLKMVFRLLLRGYAGDHRTHGGREETGLRRGS